MKLKFDDKGLLPLIVQDAASGQVLSLFYANQQAVGKMKKTGFVWRYSRSQRKLVQKGATSGSVQQVVRLLEDCDGDALLVQVRQQGKGACHAGGWSCFEQTKSRSWKLLDELCEVIAQRKLSPKRGSYVSKIVGDRAEIGFKLEEEAGELKEALLEKNDKEVVWEAADLLFFTLVALENRAIDAQRMLQELERRRK